MSDTEINTIEIRTDRGELYKREVGSRLAKSLMKIIQDDHHYEFANFVSWLSNRTPSGVMYSLCARATDYMKDGCPDYKKDGE